MGYHYCNNKVHSPIISYFIGGNKGYLLSSFDWYSDDFDISISNTGQLYSVEDCLFYGFPIQNVVYYNVMKELIDNLNTNYKNKIKVKKNSSRY